MAGRAGRAGPSVTRTQLMRQAKSSAVVRDTIQQNVAQQPGAGCPSKKPRVPKLSRKVAAPPSPKKIDFRKPGLTKAMLARMQHAKKFQSELDKRCDDTVARQKTKRKAAPLGGDARFGKERPARKKSPCPPRAREQPQWEAPPSQREMSPRSKAMQKMMMGQKATAKSPGAQGVPAKTCQLAKRMNADVVQADPVGDGPVDSIVIPAGTINENCTTIVSINQGRGGGASAGASAAHRSMQMINQSLDEQDAVEAAAVQEKLSEMHQARRDLVMAVANIGSNTAQMAEQASMARSMPQEERVIYKLPDIDHEYLRPKYGKDDNPAIIAAREHRLRMEAEMKQREVQQQMERDFATVENQLLPDDNEFELPAAPEYLYDSDPSCEEDEEPDPVVVPTCPPRRNTCLPNPVHRYSRPGEGIGIDELERFFDLENYPPSIKSNAYAGPPPGREGLHPDLWELDDPWVCQPDVPDLIEFDLMSFSK
ncbi:uncharacterized protein LOC107263076 [Cephus cinctus]|uniref:Uncharacterized protein LOC107263076 n=1 Tax=Cephus cinctus TaxID=211228 RepID=A0AAJ7BHD1_CEPCN|nr:uncharacterized protein LOC107263076 [Cephus cinctus]